MRDSDEAQRNLTVAMVSDALLVQRFRDEGDVASFEELFHRHYDRVYGLLYRLVGTRQEAEDIAQEVFLRLYNRPMSRADNVAGWLYRVATNLGYNALRGNQRREGRERNSALQTEPAPSAESAASRREQQRKVRAALAKLPPRSAQMLVLRQMDFSYQEVADIVGVAPGSVGTLLNRAAEGFRKVYEEVEDHHAHQ